MSPLLRSRRWSSLLFPHSSPVASGTFFLQNVFEMSCSVFVTPPPGHISRMALICIHLFEKVLRAAFKRDVKGHKYIQCERQRGQRRAEPSHGARSWPKKWLSDGWPRSSASWQPSPRGQPPSHSTERARRPWVPERGWGPCPGLESALPGNAW